MHACVYIRWIFAIRTEPGSHLKGLLQKRCYSVWHILCTSSTGPILLHCTLTVRAKHTGLQDALVGIPSLMLLFLCEARLCWWAQILVLQLVSASHIPADRNETDHTSAYTFPDNVLSRKSCTGPIQLTPLLCLEVNSYPWKRKEAHGFQHRVLVGPRTFFFFSEVVQCVFSCLNRSQDQQ